EAAGLRFSELSADGVVIAAREGEIRLLDVDVIERHPDHDHRIRVSGTLPFSWPLPGIVPDRERHLTVTVPSQSLDLINDLAAASTRPEAGAALQQVEQLARSLSISDGTIEARVDLEGTANSPRNSGFLTLQHGRVRLGPGDTEIRDLDARLSFAGNEVRIERCEGASSRSGRVRLSGRATLGREGPGGSAGALDLSLEVDQFRFV